MTREVFVFRQIDVGESVRFAFSVVFAHAHFWFVIGAALALAGPAASGWIWGPHPPFLGRTILFLAGGLWPLAVSTRIALLRLQGKAVGVDVLTDWSAVYRLVLPVALVVVVAGAGGLAFEGCLSLVFPKGIPPVLGGLFAPITLMGIMRYYPLICLGGITVAMPLSFAPWVAIDKNLGVSAAMEWASRLSKDVKMEMMFLQGMIFFTVSTTFLFGAFAGGKSFPGNVISYFVYTGGFAFAAAFWTEAYREVLAYEEPDAVKTGAPRQVFRVG